MRAPGRRRKANGNNAAALPQNPHEGRRAYCKIGTEDGGYAASPTRRTAAVPQEKGGKRRSCRRIFRKRKNRRAPRVRRLFFVVGFYDVGLLLTEDVPSLGEVVCARKRATVLCAARYTTTAQPACARRGCGRPFAEVSDGRASSVGRRAAHLKSRRKPRGGGLFCLETCSSKLGGAPAFLRLFLWQESHCGCSPATSFAA